MEIVRIFIYKTSKAKRILLPTSLTQRPVAIFLNSYRLNVRHGFNTSVLLCYSYKCRVLPFIFQYSVPIAINNILKTVLVVFLLPGHGLVMYKTLVINIHYRSHTIRRNHNWRLWNRLPGIYNIIYYTHYHRAEYIYYNMYDITLETYLKYTHHKGPSPCGPTNVEFNFSFLRIKPKEH